MTSTDDIMISNASLSITDPYQNITDAITMGKCSSVHDIALDKTVRLLILILTISLNIVGSTLVILWIVCNRQVLVCTKSKRHTRVNAFILHLTAADFLVIMLAVFPQLLWEYADRQWMAGPVMCRLVKLVQSFSIISSNYMLVVIAVDRHQAIRSPLKKIMPVWKMAGTGWILALLVSLPVMGIFHINTSADGETRCENIFRNLPQWHRQLWVTYVCVVVFFIPLILLAVCYVRIFMKISTKVQRYTNHDDKGGPRRGSCVVGELYVHTKNSNKLPKAKIKALKMTFVIILVFIVCSLPYFIVEMIMSYGDHCIISRMLYGLLGGMAACNSATNPFVFLLFNVRKRMVFGFMKCRDCSFHQVGNHPLPGLSGITVTMSHYNLRRGSAQSFGRCGDRQGSVDTQVILMGLLKKSDHL